MSFLISSHIDSAVFHGAARVPAGHSPIPRLSGLGASPWPFPLPSICRRSATTSVVCCSLPSLSFQDGRGRDRDACHSAAFRGVTQFRIAAEVTQEDHLPLVGDFPSFGEIVETLNREGHELLHPGPGRGVQRCLPRRDGNRGDAGLLPHDSACVAAEALRNAFRHAGAIPAAAHAYADATRRSWLADKLPSKSEGSGS